MVWWIILLAVLVALSLFVAVVVAESLTLKRVGIALNIRPTVCFYEMA